MKIFKIIFRSTKAENVCGLYYGLHKFCSFGSKRFWFDLLLNQKFKKQQDLKKMSKNCNLSIYNVFSPLDSKGFRMVSKNVQILLGECIGIFLFLTVALGKCYFLKTSFYGTHQNISFRICCSVGPWNKQLLWYLRWIRSRCCHWYFHRCQSLW